jgi:hypothetical protein
MSLDVWLVRKKWTSYDNCVTFTESEETVFECNITHNLGEMAKKAGIYLELWRPEEIGKTKANELIEILKKSLKELKRRPAFYQKFEPINKFGCYKDLVYFVENYLEACKKYPEAKIEISR